MKTKQTNFAFMIICSFLIFGSLFSAGNLGGNKTFAKSANLQYQIETVANNKTDKTLLATATTNSTKAIPDEEDLAIIRTIQERSKTIQKDAENYADYDTLLYSQKIEITLFVTDEKMGLETFLTTHDQKGEWQYGAFSYFKLSEDPDSAFAVLKEDKEILEKLLEKLKEYPNLMETKKINMLNNINTVYKNAVLEPKYNIKDITTQYDMKNINEDIEKLNNYKNAIPNSYILAMSSEEGSENEIDKLTGKYKYDTAIETASACLNKFNALVLYESNIAKYKANELLSKPVLETMAASKGNLLALKKQLEDFQRQTLEYVSDDQRLKVSNLIWQTNIRLAQIEGKKPNISNSKWPIIFGSVIGMTLILMGAFVLKIFIDRKKQAVPYYKEKQKDTNINAKANRGEMPTRLYFTENEIKNKNTENKENEFNEKDESEILKKYEEDLKNRENTQNDKKDS